MQLEPKQVKRSLIPDLVGLGLLVFILLLFFNMESIKGEDSLFTLSTSWLNVNTIFLSIVIEAAPFLMLGVFVSSLIQVYVKDDVIYKFLPKNPVAALFPAALLGAILPICECAIVPVVRRLIKKGMPVHCGVVFLVGAPILNPVVFASTFFAFRTNLTVLYSRMALAFFLAVLIGGIIYYFLRNASVLKGEDSPIRLEQTHGHEHAEEQDLHTGAHSHEHAHTHKKPRPLHRVKQTLFHTADEFFDMGKYLIIGAFIAALFQTFMDRQVLLWIGTNDWSSTMVMMAFAYVMSLCSEADAFVAASFGSMFTTGSVVAFLVYGPMLDLKNTIMLLAFFKWKFVLIFIVTVTVTVFSSIMFLQFFLF